MDSDLRCNRLTCRRTLSDKAVVTTCSHLFCVDCANELFNASRLCPACETSLTEPDDVVVCSLHPSNDYKTSVLSGLSPSIILEICGRAIAFWQYQIHQENSFQQAVVRSVNDKNAQLQKQLESVVREANAEIGLLSNKIRDLERDFEMESRKVRDLQESSRDRDKEYTKLKNQYDRIKRKALLAPQSVGQGDNVPNNFGGPINPGSFAPALDDPAKARTGLGFSMNSANNTVDLGVVVGGMEANGVQRTPISTRTAGANGFTTQPNPFFQGQQQQQPPPFVQHQFQPQRRHRTQRPPADQTSYRTSNASERSDSANEVEKMLGFNERAVPRVNQAANGWNAHNTMPPQSNQRPVPVSSKKRLTNGFRPVAPLR